MIARACHQPDDFGRELQQSEGVGDGRAGFADPVGEFVLRHAVILHEGTHGRGRLYGVQILALQIFYQRDLFDLPLGIIFDDDGDLF